MAFEIARSPHLVDEALSAYRRVTYTPGSQATKTLQETLVGTTVCRTGPSALSADARLRCENSAVLSKAGCRSAHLHSCVAQQRNRRLPNNVPISEPTLLALQDAHGAVNRELGPSTRAKEKRLDLWDQLQPEIDTHHVGVALSRRGRDPVGGFFTWRFATNLLSWEIELALLDLHSDTTSFDVLAATVNVRLSASEGDPRGRTAARTTENWKCFGGSGDRSGEVARPLPLIDTCQDSLCPVEKTHMVHALKSDASLFVGQSGAKFDTSMKCEGLEPNTWRV